MSIENSLGQVKDYWMMKDMFYRISKHTPFVLSLSKDKN